MSDKEKQANQLNIELTEEVAEGQYSNLAIITHGNSEFIIDFIRVMPGVPKAKVKSRIIMTPQHAKRLLKALGDNIAKYEKAHGDIDDNEGFGGLPMTFVPRQRHDPEYPTVNDLVENKNILLSVISPVYLGGQLIEPLVKRISASVSTISSRFEIILVDDGSPDNSWQQIEHVAGTNPVVTGIKLNRNYGQHAAIKAGLEHCSGRWIIIMDCDLQDPPEAIPGLYQKALEGFDCVYALRDKRNDLFLKRFYSWVFYSVLGIISSMKFDARLANFGIYGRELILRVVSMPFKTFFFPLMVRKQKPRASAITVIHAKREIGKTTYTFVKALKMAIHILWSNSFFGGKPAENKSIYSIEKMTVSLNHDPIQ